MHPSDEQPESLAESPMPLPRMAYQILLVLAAGANHGYAIAKEIERNSDGRTRPGTGSLYLSMAKLKDKGLIASSEPPTLEPRTDSRRRFYRLTDRGRAIAAAESQRMLRLLELAQRRDLLDPQSRSRLLHPAPAKSGG